MLTLVSRPLLLSSEKQERTQQVPVRLRMSAGEGVKSSKSLELFVQAQNVELYVPPLLPHQCYLICSKVLIMQLGMASWTVLPVTISKVKSLFENEARKQIEPNCPVPCHITG